MSKLVSYLHSRDITSNFFWHIGMDGNPTGIVKDWTTFPPVIDAGKLNLLRKLVPKPTRILDHIPSAERNRERTSDLELREECIDGVCRSAGPGRRRRVRRRRVIKYHGGVLPISFEKSFLKMMASLLSGLPPPLRTNSEPEIIP